MNVILYSTDFEPITVVDLPRWILDRAEEQGSIRIMLKSVTEPALITVYCKKLRWDDNSVKSILVTSDEIPALKLQPAWLPGQTAAVQNSSKLLHKLHNKVIELMRKN